jgi:hypothetical protein
LFLQKHPVQVVDRLRGLDGALNLVETVVMDGFYPFLVTRISTKRLLKRKGEYWP